MWIHDIAKGESALFQSFEKGQKKMVNFTQNQINKQ